MNMIKKVVALCSFFTSIIDAGPIVTFFFKDYPTEVLAQQHLDRFKKPHSLAKRNLEGIIAHNPKAGIFATYYGFLDVSNYTGQIVFPRKQSEGTISVYVTDKITPIIAFSNTLSHWELVPENPVSGYQFQFIEDPTTGLFIWNVQPKEAPQDGKIPAQKTIVIIAKPKNIYIPTGASMTSQDANLQLPNMYVKKGICSECTALYVLNMNYLFRPVDEIYKHEKSRYGFVVQD